MQGRSFPTGATMPKMNASVRCFMDESIHQMALTSCKGSTPCQIIVPNIYAPTQAFNFYTILRQPQIMWFLLFLSVSCFLSFSLLSSTISFSFSLPPHLPPSCFLKLVSAAITFSPALISFSDSGFLSTSPRRHCDYVAAHR